MDTALTEQAPCSRPAAAPHPRLDPCFSQVHPNDKQVPGLDEVLCGVSP